MHNDRSSLCIRDREISCIIFGLMRSDKNSLFLETGFRGSKETHEHIGHLH